MRKLLTKMTMTSKTVAYLAAGMAAASSCTSSVEVNLASKKKSSLTQLSTLDISSSSADGSYSAGQTISIQVTFPQVVTVTGKPQITLETGTSDAVVEYTSGSGSNVLHFNYTIGSGQETSDLDYASQSAISLNGGTITDANGAPVEVTLPAPGALHSLGYNKNIKITSSSLSLTAYATPSVLKDLLPSTSSYNDSGYVKNFKALANGTVLFVAMDYENGEEVWTTDGTDAGTHILTDTLNPEASTYPGALFLSTDKSKAYFGCTTHQKGLGVCESDGTAAGTRRIGGTFESVNQIVQCGSNIFVRGKFGSYGQELAVSDGTADFSLVKDMTPGATDSSFLSGTQGVIHCLNSKIYFGLSNATTLGDELWESDGTAAGTQMVADIYAGTTSGLAEILGVANGKILMRASDATYFRELWAYDPTAADCSNFQAAATCMSGAAGGKIGVVKDLFPGGTATTNTGVQSSAFVSNGKLYFNGRTSASDAKLWVTDGTNTGTAVVAGWSYQLNPTTLHTAAVYENGASTRVYFVGAYSGASAGSEPYMIDFTPMTGGNTCVSTYGANYIDVTAAGLSGCVGPIYDFNPGSGSSNAIILGANANGVYFQTTFSGTSTYFSKGSQGAAPHYNLLSSSIGSLNGTNLVNASGMFFAYEGATTTIGRELSFADMTSISLVKDINPSPSTFGTRTTATSRVVAATKTYFWAYVDGLGMQLHVTDGTAQGTSVVTINPSSASYPAGGTNQIVIGDDLYISANDGTNGIELWKVNGTTAAMVKNINATGDGINTSAFYLRAMNGALYFRASDGTGAGQYASELWKYDPAATDCSAFDPTTTYGTSCNPEPGIPGKIGIVKDIRTGTGANGAPDNFSVIGNRLYFTAVDGTASATVSGSEAWYTDGTYASTFMIHDINTGTASSSVNYFRGLGSGAAFRSTDPTYGDELFYFTPSNAADTTACQTAFGTEFIKANAAGCLARLTNINTAGNSSINFYSARQLDSGKLFFTASDGNAATGTELYVTDGTSAGTVLVKDFFVGVNSGFSGLVNAGTIGNLGTDKFVFMASNGFAANGENNQQIWISDGTTANTIKLTSNAAPYQPRGITISGSKIYFVAGDSSTGLELWVSDGTVSGTRMVNDTCPGTCDGATIGSELSQIAGIVPLKDSWVVFRGQSATSGQEYVISNGEASGTTVIDAVPGSEGSRPIWFTRMSDDRLIFAGYDPTLGYELWSASP